MPRHTEMLFALAVLLLCCFMLVLLLWPSLTHPCLVFALPAVIARAVQTPNITF
jgi:hypothetical protein